MDENEMKLSANENNVSDYSIYPNPSKNFIYVKSATAILQLRIFDQLGNLIVSEFSQNRIDISALSKGLYFMQINDEDGGKILKKIIRE